MLISILNWYSAALGPNRNLVLLLVLHLLEVPNLTWINQVIKQLMVETGNELAMAGDRTSTVFGWFRRLRRTRRDRFLLLPVPEVTPCRI